VYFARTALRGLATSPVTSTIAVATIGVSLVLVGAFTLLLRNMEELIDEFGAELHVTAYLEEGLPASEQAELARVVATVEGVSEVRSVSKEEALERFRQGVGRGASLLEGLDENPLPASLEMVLSPGHRSAEGLARVAAAIEGVPGVADLTSGRDWVEGYLRAVAVVRGVGWGLGAVIALATLLIVANTIRLAVFARRDELEILSLVGASRSFVGIPFLVEGMLEGAAGGTLALALLYGLYHLVLPGFSFGLELVLGSAPRFFSPPEALGLLLLGAGLGLLGSAAALSGGWRR
jgi:cell division transport system permease protein